MNFESFVKTLPPKQKAVAQALMENHSVPEIAKMLDVKKSTVVTHKVAVFKKVGVNSIEGFLKKFREFGVCRFCKRALDQWDDA